MNHTALEEFYRQYNHRSFVHPDPLEFLYLFPRLEDREIVGLIASCLAYGNVTQILKSIAFVLEPMGESPRRFVELTSDRELKKIYSRFKHRWHTGADVSALLSGLRKVIENYGSLEECLRHGFLKNNGETILALSFFVGEIMRCDSRIPSHLIPSPDDGSACKRLFMYLRWMIRCDEVDPGGWDSLSSSKLIVPLDTHMFRMARSFRMTRRKQADLKSALEITACFRKMAPDDPVRYDFVLTRPGIWRKRELVEKLIKSKN